MLLRSTVRYLPAQLIGPLFQVISVIVWTHVTDQSTLGVVTLVAATYELLQTVFLFWWSQSALRFFGSFQSDEDAARYYGTENAVMLASVAVQSAIALIILHMQIAPGADLALSVAVVGYVVTRSYNLYIAERARVRHEILVYTIQQSAGPALGFLLGLLLIRLFGPEPEWAIAGFAIAQGAAVLAVLPMMRFGWRVGPVDRAILKQALHYGFPLVLGGGFAWVSANASRFVVSNMLGIGAAGLFAVGYGLGWRTAAVAAMLVTASAFPIAVRKMEEGGSIPALRQLSENGALLTAVLLPSIAGVFLLRWEIVHLLIAPSFQEATLTILPLAAFAGIIRNCRAHFSDQVFLLHRRTHLLIIINGIEAALTVGMSICSSVVGAARQRGCQCRGGVDCRHSVIRGGYRGLRITAAVCASDEDRCGDRPHDARAVCPAQTCDAADIGCAYRARRRRLWGRACGALSPRADVDVE